MSWFKRHPWWTAVFCATIGLYIVGAVTDNILWYGMRVGNLWGVVILWNIPRLIRWLFRSRGKANDKVQEA